MRVAGVQTDYESEPIDASSPQQIGSDIDRMLAQGSSSATAERQRLLEEGEPDVELAVRRLTRKRYLLHSATISRPQEYQEMGITYFITTFNPTTTTHTFATSSAGRSAGRNALLAEFTGPGSPW